jgi:exonuclease III
VETMSEAELSIVTFNCRSIKNCISEVHELCEKHDIVLLQEHWLLPYDLHLLNSMHDCFISVGNSAVNVTSNLLQGRPFGGTAILYRKELAKICKQLTIENDRMTAMLIDVDGGKLLLLNVYMPTNYNNDDSYEEYMMCCEMIKSLLVDPDIVSVIIAGDFNTRPDARTYVLLTELLLEQKLRMIDVQILDADTFTYVSDDGRNMSWIDHVLCSDNISRYFSNMQVLYGYVCSDHKPVSFCVAVRCNKPQIVNRLHASCIGYTGKLQWHKCTQNVLDNFATRCEYIMNELVLDVETRNCSTIGCHCDRHKRAIDEYYCELTSAIKNICAEIIPSSNVQKTDFAVPGWNDCVEELHVQARDAFLRWVQCGRPRGGVVFECMNNTRRLFKSTLRACKVRSEQIRANRLAESLLTDHSGVDFWHEVKKSVKHNCYTSIQTVNNVSGDDNIVRMWKDVYSKLYNTLDVTNACAEYIEMLNTVNTDTQSNCQPFVVTEICEAISKLKKGKACGVDGVYGEALIHGSFSLRERLCDFFNTCLMHSYLPDKLMESVFVPLPKCKHGDLSDISNYRAIAISSCISKVLEGVVLKRLEGFVSSADMYQFGFKKHSSTTLCTHMLKQVVNYYRNRGSHVFACFLDISKAFDKVNYWLLFKKMLAAGMPKHIVQLLAFWYSKQMIRVRWNNVYSEPFCVSNGTRQGSVLSPFLFSFYINDVISNIVSSKVGCFLRGICCNILAYADDLVLLAPSWRAMQSLIDMCVALIANLDLVFNNKKTVCLMFKPTDNHLTVRESFPLLTLGETPLQYVDKVRYLGHIVHRSGSDDDDISREVASLFYRANMLRQKFGNCSHEVKVLLFRTYCICLYGTALWQNFSIGAITRFKSAYARSMKLLFGRSKFYRTTYMLLETNLPSVDTVLHNYSLSFKNSLMNTVNQLLCCTQMVL